MSKRGHLCACSSSQSPKLSAAQKQQQPHLVLLPQAKHLHSKGTAFGRAPLAAGLAIAARRALGARQRRRLARSSLQSSCALRRGCDGSSRRGRGSKAGREGAAGVAEVVGAAGAAALQQVGWLSGAQGRAVRSETRRRTQKGQHAMRADVCTVGPLPTRLRLGLNVGINSQARLSLRGRRQRLAGGTQAAALQAGKRRRYGDCQQVCHSCRHQRPEPGPPTNLSCSPASPAAQLTPPPRRQ